MATLYLFIYFLATLYLEEVYILLHTTWYNTNFILLYFILSGHPVFVYLLFTHPEFARSACFVAHFLVTLYWCIHIRSICICFYFWPSCIWQKCMNCCTLHNIMHDIKLHKCKITLKFYILLEPFWSPCICSFTFWPPCIWQKCMFCCTLHNIMHDIKLHKCKITL